MTPGESLTLTLILLSFVLPVIGIFDAANRPAHQWEAIGHNRFAWIFLQLVLGIIGAVLYLAFLRPKLQRLA